MIGLGGVGGGGGGQWRPFASSKARTCKSRNSSLESQAFDMRASTGNRLLLLIIFLFSLEPRTPS